MKKTFKSLLAVILVVAIVLPCVNVVAATSVPYKKTGTVYTINGDSYYQAQTTGEYNGVSAGTYFWLNSNLDIVTDRDTIAQLMLVDKYYNAIELDPLFITNFLNATRLRGEAAEGYFKAINNLNFAEKMSQWFGSVLGMGLSVLTGNPIALADVALDVVGDAVSPETIKTGAIVDLMRYYTSNTVKYAKMSEEALTGGILTEYNTINAAVYYSFCANASFEAFLYLAGDEIEKCEKDSDLETFLENSISGFVDSILPDIPAVELTKYITDGTISLLEFGEKSGSEKVYSEKIQSQMQSTLLNVDYSKVDENVEKAKNLAKTSESSSNTTVGSMTSSSSQSTYTTDENVVIRWTEATNAIRYGLTIVNDATNEDVVNDSNFTGTEYIVGKLPAGTYRFNMRGYNSNGDYGPVSVVNEFTVKEANPSSSGSSSSYMSEYAIFPGTILGVTQGAYGEYNSFSHNGQTGYKQLAFDFCNDNKNYFAPFDGTITKIKTSYNAVVLQSDNKVYWANGDYDYMSVCFVHDNDISDLYEGKKIKQGEIFYQPGVKDYSGATVGSHVHLCVNKGKTNSGIDIFSGDVRPNDAFFVAPGTTIRATGNYKWIDLPSNIAGDDNGDEDIATIVKDNFPAVPESYSEWSTSEPESKENRDIISATQYGYFHYIHHWTDTGFTGAYPVEDYKDFGGTDPTDELVRHIYWSNEQYSKVDHWNSTTTTYDAFTNVCCDLGSNVSTDGKYLYDLNSTRTIYCYKDTDVSKAPIADGTCGATLIWELYADGTLEISGTGDMANYSGSNSPWVSYREQIKEVTVGNGVTSIGQYAFYNCDALTKAVISDSVKTINYSAFAGCGTLTEVVLGRNVTTIGDDVFENCSKLAVLTIPDAATSISSSATSNSYPFRGTAISVVKVPSTVTSVHSAFINLPSVAKYECEESEYIGGVGYFDDGGILYVKNIYNDSQNLVKCPPKKTISEYTIKDGTTGIGASSFTGKTSLKSIVIPATVTSIGKSAFSGCTNLSNISWTEGLTTIDSYAFQGNGALKALTFPDSVKTISEYAFSNCSALTTVEIGEGVTSIGQNAFYNCDALTKAVISDSVKTINYSAFAGCGTLTEVVLGRNVTTIGDDVFENCSKLAVLTIPDAATSISSSATSNSYPFRGTAISVVKVPSTVTSVHSAFINLPSVAKYECEESEYIGGVGYFDDGGILYVKNIYNDSQNLVKCPPKKTISEYTIKDGTTGIGASSFTGKTSLKSIVIPATVTSIGKSAFSGCTYLKECYFYGSAPVSANFGSNVFNGTDAAFTIYYISGESGWTTPAWNGYKTATFVPESSSITVTGVTLNKTATTLTVGASETLTTTVSPTNATNKAVTWTSSNTTVATVSSSGVVTAKATGTTTITATTVDGSKTATCIVTVNEAPIVDADVTYTIGSASGKPGSTVDVALSVTSDVTVNGLLLDNLSYDENALEFVEFAEYGDLITTSALGANGVNSNNGEISLGYTNAVKPNGQICIIKFRVKDTAEDGEYTISIDGAASANGQKLPSKVNSGKIMVSKWMSGDFDNDEKLDMNDVVYFMSWVNFSWTGKYPMGYEGNKDFNKDGSVDMEDVVYFMSWVNFSWTGKYDINW